MRGPCMEDSKTELCCILVRAAVKTGPAASEEAGGAKTTRQRLSTRFELHQRKCQSCARYGVRIVGSIVIIFCSYSFLCLFAGGLIIAVVALEARRISVHCVVVFVFFLCLFGGGLLIAVVALEACMISVHCVVAVLSVCFLRVYRGGSIVVMISILVCSLLRACVQRRFNSCYDLDSCVQLVAKHFACPVTVNMLGQRGLWCFEHSVAIFWIRSASRKNSVLVHLICLGKLRSPLPCSRNQCVY